MKRSHLMYTCLLLVVLLAYCCVPAAAYRLIRYDRATGQTAVLYADEGSAPYDGVCAINSQSLAYTRSDGIYMMDLDTGVSTLVSSDTSGVGDNFGLSDQYIVWRSSAKSLSTGTVTTISQTGVDLWSNLIAWGDGDSYQVLDLDTQQQVSSGTGALLDMAGGVVVAKTGIETKYDFYGGTYYTLTYQGFDALTGQATGWECEVSTKGQELIHPMLSDTRLHAYYDGWRFGGYPRVNCPLDNASHSFAAQEGFPYIGCWYEALWNDYYAGYHCTARSIRLEDLDSSTGDWIYSYEYYSIVTGHLPDIRGVELNDDYVVWFDDLVPEPSSLAALASALGCAGLVVRRRKR